MKSTKLLRKPLIMLLVMALIAALLGTGVFAAAANEPSEPGSMKSTPQGYDVTRNGAGAGGDDTQAIQNALDRYTEVYIPDGNYLINADRSLHLRSNQTLTLSSGATLRALPSASGSYSILKLNSVSGVSITGGRIVGERDTHRGAGGEWGMGINVMNGSDNISISNIAISYCWGDGIYLGDGAAVTNITISGVTCDNNRRQGISVTNASFVTITDCTLKNTNGTAPEAGIDLEPYNGFIVSDITMNNVQCVGNAGSGLDMLGGDGTIRNIKVTGGTFSGNAGVGVRASYVRGLQMAGCDISGNMFGMELPNDVSDVKCSGLTISGNKAHGVSLVTAYQKEGISDVLFESTVFSNNSQEWSFNTDGIRIDRYDDTGFIRNITFRGCTFSDNQAVKTQGFGLSVGFGSGMSGIVVEPTCMFTGNIYAGYFGGNALRVL